MQFFIEHLTMNNYVSILLCYMKGWSEQFCKHVFVYVSKNING